MLGLRLYSISCNKKWFKTFQFIKQFNLKKKKSKLFSLFLGHKCYFFFEFLISSQSWWKWAADCHFCKTWTSKYLVFFLWAKKKKKTHLISYCTLTVLLTSSHWPFDTSVALGLRGIVKREAAQQVTLPTQPSAVFFVDWWSECSKLMSYPTGFVRELCGCWLTNIKQAEVSHIGQWIDTDGQKLTPADNSKTSSRWKISRNSVDVSNRYETLWEEDVLEVVCAVFSKSKRRKPVRHFLTFKVNSFICAPKTSWPKITDLNKKGTSTKHTRLERLPQARFMLSVDSHRQINWQHV